MVVWQHESNTCLGDRRQVRLTEQRRGPGARPLLDRTLRRGERLRLYVDTSALYSLLDRNDHNHAVAKETWRQLLADDVRLVTSSYVLIEATALIQSAPWNYGAA